MEIIISTAMFLGYLGYQAHQQTKEKVSLIRELSFSLKSEGSKEYIDIIPEPSKEKIELVNDELVDVGEIDPTVLLRSLK